MEKIMLTAKKKEKISKCLEREERNSRGRVCIFLTSVGSKTHSENPAAGLLTSLPSQ